MDTIDTGMEQVAQKRLRIKELEHEARPLVERAIELLDHRDELDKNGDPESTKMANDCQHEVEGIVPRLQELKKKIEDLNDEVREILIPARTDYICERIDWE